MVLPAVQLALNTAWRKRLQATPYHVMIGRESPMAILLSSKGTTRAFNLFRLTTTGHNSWWFLWWMPRRISWQGCCNTSAPIVFCTADIRDKVLPHFTVVDYVLVAGVSRQGKHRKLMSTWFGPWRVADHDKY